jgi:hypothetical protein
MLLRDRTAIFDEDWREKRRPRSEGVAEDIVTALQEQGGEEEC